MRPGNYTIPQPVQAAMLELGLCISAHAAHAAQPSSRVNPRRLAAMLAMAERLETLGRYDFSNGNELVLLKPRFTFAYIRHACDWLLGDWSLDQSLTSTEIQADHARNVRSWLDEIGHTYPTR